MGGELRLPVLLVVVTWDMFSNGRGLTDKRHCVNSVSIKLVPEKSAS